jgi:hypothetical protein
MPTSCIYTLDQKPLFMGVKFFMVQREIKEERKKYEWIQKNWMEKEE